MLSIEDYIKQPFEFEAELNSLFDKDDELIIFDVGACEGEDSVKFSRRFPNSKVYAFEPLPKNFEKIKNNLDKYVATNINVSQVALSNKKGKSIFFVSSGRPQGTSENDWDYGNKSSSLLRPAKVKKVHEWLSFDEEVSVKTSRLDQFMKDNKLTKIDFLYMDVQGAELMVLEGAGEFLKDIRAVWMEVESVELYKNQPLKEDVEIFMQKNGFYKLKDTVDDISGDQLFVRYKDYLTLTNRESRGGITNFKKYGRRIVAKLRSQLQLKNHSIKSKYRHDSYAQCGEDIIIKNIFDAIKITNPTYVDIGAHHPFYLSNTALFYRSGSRGINIEPDPKLFSAFEKFRKHDTNLNIGISSKQGNLIFYVMDPPTLNTFSKSEAKKYVGMGHTIIEEKEIPVRTLDEVISEYLSGIPPDIIFIDVEGMDYEILKSYNFMQSNPLVVCVETISYTTDDTGKKDKRIIDYMIKSGYAVYADTHINTIFVKETLWRANESIF